MAAGQTLVFGNKLSDLIGLILRDVGAVSLPVCNTLTHAQTWTGDASKHTLQTHSRMPLQFKTYTHVNT